MNTKHDHFIYGTRAVIEALNAGKTLDRIWIQKGLSNTLYHELRQALKGLQIPLLTVPAEKLQRLGSKNHQGVIAVLAEIHYADIFQIVQQCFERAEHPLVLVLDQITDVRNFGAIARAALCAGVHAILIPSKGAAQINSDAIKTSAGALHHIAVCRVPYIAETLQQLKSSGLQIIACHEKTASTIYTTSLLGPLAIIMGSEDKGISPAYIKCCDAEVSIPMRGPVESLNVAVATGIVLFERLRQTLN